MITDAIKQSTIIEPAVVKGIQEPANETHFKRLALTTTEDSYPASHPDASDEPYLTPTFINNKMILSKSETWYDVFDPVTNNVVAKVPETTEEEFEKAVVAADAAFHKWKKVSVIKRQAVAFKFVELLKRNQERIARVIVLEEGKVISDARADVLRGLQVAELACAYPYEMMGQQQEVSTDMDTLMIREPIGIIGSVCPFNFPAMITLWTLPLVIVTGNSTIMKPSEVCPGATMIIGQLAAEAGCPPGVINLVHGKIPIANKLVEDPRIPLITFVGGNEAGKIIYTKATALGKRCQANLGAKNHMVVLPDANKKLFIKGVMAGAFGGCGQRCVSTDILFCVGSTKEWIPEIVAQLATLKTDSGFLEDSDLGPLVSKASQQRIERIITESVAMGAEIPLDGRGYYPTDYPNGYFLAPTIMTNVRPGMPCIDEEMFAPLLAIWCVDTIDEAIDIINSNRFGNGVSLFTSSGVMAKKFTTNVDVGQIGVNVPVPVPLPMFGFTGTKGSILGDLNFYGKTGLLFMTKPKTITSFWRE